MVSIASGSLLVRVCPHLTNAQNVDCDLTLLDTFSSGIAPAAFEDKVGLFHSLKVMNSCLT